MNEVNKNVERSYQVMTMGDWFVTLLILAIPIVNFIMLFVWGFGSNDKPSRANYCKLSLLLMLIVVVVWIILLIAGVSLFSFARFWRYHYPPETAGIFFLFFLQYSV